MGALRRKPEEEALLKTAMTQQGLLKYEHLLQHGLDRNAIRHRQETCRLNRIFDQVYAFGHTALRDEAYWLGALWTSGERDVLSHFTAGAFHGWRIEVADRRIHVSTTAETTSRDDLVVHRVKTLPPIDVFTRGEYRVTHIPRTLVDLADVMAWKDFRALADSLPHLHVGAIRAAQERAPGRAGRGKVRRLIEADDAHTKSEFERRYLRFSRAHGLPKPDELNVTRAGHKADCVYHTRRQLIVELDGRAYHERRAQMRADRRRDVDYQVAGFLILRLVWDDLHRDSAPSTADRIRQMLAVASA